VSRRTTLHRTQRRIDPVVGAPTWYARSQELTCTRHFGGETFLPEIPAERDLPSLAIEAAAKARAAG